ncbi:sulfate adenylyltransferase [Polynucleobacter sp. MWH-Spelu-300-X4]|uniref:sulfate adenylyltransferase subunit 1 n=1 Tax=Polynucleobacter sp. MWH-Spelu-300-X4 TaxID=2689109 RepID=UPI001BFECF9E|nr:GTP-binding protein [Polynucleobacter sp. MWH-Spelu-300-X4]QWD80149.1 sulfate adenylyltransferase [Polynucleobacter sp. MWH-Spelu-300-X4]
MSQGVVRFITAGSVDDGKSTLIGRLLYDTKAVLADQLLALSKTKHARVTASDAAVDLALLTDGLEAEREQGITIDVAYRYFATAKRKFIVADAPGHEQYTRNLVTGASQADVAVLLVDATRVDLSVKPAGLLAQTKRHSAIVRLLGLRHVAVAVNKMDLLGFDEKVFNAIKESIEGLAKTLGLPAPHLIPVSALQGDNVVEKSDKTPWYQGPSLLQWLEGLDTSVVHKVQSLRFPVQYVARQDGSAADDFRGYLGRIESGSIKKGQKVTVLPSGLEATVSEIHVGNDHQAAHGAAGVDLAKAGQVIALRLAEDVDVSRGDLIVASESVDAPVLTKQISADICWLDSEPLSLARKYVLRHTTNTVFAKVKGIQQVLDVQTLSHGTDIHALNMNEIGRVDLVLQKPIAADLFDDAPSTGAFVLIDEATNHTVAAGMVRGATA